jgi:hypothetical protein
VKEFTVPHVRKSGDRYVRLNDPRDIYELVANNGARRLRACILAIIPRDITDAAVDQCAATLKAKIKIDDALIESLLAKFDAYGVKRKALEANIQRRLESITPALVIRLGDIYNSLEDGMSGPARLVRDRARGTDRREQGRCGARDARRQGQTGRGDLWDGACRKHPLLSLLRPRKRSPRATLTARPCRDRHRPRGARETPWPRRRRDGHASESPAPNVVVCADTIRKAPSPGLRRPRTPRIVCDRPRFVCRRMQTTRSRFR